MASLGWSKTVADDRFAKHLDEQLIQNLAVDHEVLITIEEGAIGGFAAHVMHYLANVGLFDKGLKFRSMTLPDIFIDLGTTVENGDTIPVRLNADSLDDVFVFTQHDSSQVQGILLLSN